MLESCWKYIGEGLERCCRGVRDTNSQRTPRFFSVCNSAAAKMCCFTGRGVHILQFFSNQVILFLRMFCIAVMWRLVQISREKWKFVLSLNHVDYTV